MYAATKGAVRDAVLYGTRDGVYPQWFHDEVLDTCYDDSTGKTQYILSDETDDVFDFETLLPYKSIFIKNKYGEIGHTTLEKFDEQYYSLGSFVSALKEDCVEYFILTKDTVMQDVPNWVKARIDSDGVVWLDHDWVFWYPETWQNSTYMVTPPCVFIKNNKGDLRYMSLDEFNKYFDTPSSYPDPEYFK